MTKCQICNKQVNMPFKCRYCSGFFCDEHRLPESHNCTWTPKESAEPENNQPIATRKPPQKNEFISESEYHFVRKENTKPIKQYKKSKKFRVKKVIGTIIGVIDGLLILLLIGLFFFAPVLFNQVFMPTTVNVDQVENQIFDLINSERNDRGLPELATDSNLELIANQWSDDLIDLGKLSHGDFSGRVAQIGYSYYQCGEIIAWQQGWTWNIAQDFVDGWINSAGHYEIMMTSATGYMGVGVSKEGADFYAVVDFRFN
ncbi:MAG: CAP domain-containing protein [Candidatus Bathyarchaeum tardum]|nr:MAG: CAP domain-containing protein [Candidatus Bathyarchaeum tardum]